LRRYYLFPEEYRAAGVDAITTILADNCRSAFGRDHTQQLIDLCQQTFTRPIGRQVIHQCVHYLTTDVLAAQKQKSYFLKTGYGLIKGRQEAKLLRTSTGAGVSNTLALVSKLGDIHGYPSGAHVTSFLGLTTSKHISGTTLFQSKRIARQGSTNGRYAAVLWSCT
jgi:hypothetical protein